MCIRERRAPVAVEPAVRSCEHKPAAAALTHDQDRSNPAQWKANDAHCANPPTNRLMISRSDSSAAFKTLN
jgi:hypothetical protein